MDLEQVIHLQPGYLLEQLDDDIVVYHPTLTTSLYCNQTGAIIWQLCDGQRTVADIIALLCGHYPDSADSIPHEVTAVVAELVSNGVAYLGRAGRAVDHATG